MKKIFTIKTAKAMQALGAKCAKACGTPLRIYLRGELGAGKTTWVRGFLRGLGYEKLVKSPTYTLVELYEIQSKKIYHFDLYRLTDPNELEYLGVRDYFISETICLVEWPERAPAISPHPDLKISIETTIDGRVVTIVAPSAIGVKVLSKL